MNAPLRSCSYGSRFRLFEAEDFSKEKIVPEAIGSIFVSKPKKARTAALQCKKAPLPHYKRVQKYSIISLLILSQHRVFCRNEGRW